MLLINKLNNATRNDAQSSLFREINQLFTSTLTQLKDVYLDADMNKYSRYIIITEQFNNLYKIANARFRNLFFDGTSENNTSVNLYNKTFNRVSYVDVVKTAHPEYKFDEVNKYYIKFEYDICTFWELFKENLTLLYAKYGNKVHYLQIIMTYLKVIIDNFHINKVNWHEIATSFTEIINTYDDEEIRYNVMTYGTKPVRQRKKGIKYNSKTKTKSLDFQVKELLDAGVKKKDICKQLGVGKTTLFRMIKNNPYLQ